MTFSRTVLWLTALMFAAFGSWSWVAPDSVASFIGIQPTSADGRTELRAIYGGLEFGLAAFAAVCALLSDPARVRLGCAAMALVMGFTALARLTGIVVDDSASSTTLTVLAIELTIAVLALLGARRDEAKKTV